MRKNKIASGKTGIAAVAAAAALSVGFTPVFAQQNRQQSDMNRQPNQMDRADRMNRMDRMVSASSLDGTRVVDQQNQEVGTISNIFVDPRTGRIARADIDFNNRLFDNERTYSVSWDHISLERRGNNIVATLDPSFVDRLQRTSPGENASNNQQRNQQISHNDLSSKDISKIQQKLNQQGFAAGHVTGQWNQDTQTALKNFQQFKGIQSTGQLDNRTLDELGMNPDDLRNENQSNFGNGPFGANQGMNR